VRGLQSNLCWICTISRPIIKFKLLNLKEVRSLAETAPVVRSSSSTSAFSKIFLIGMSALDLAAAFSVNFRMRHSNCVKHEEVVSPTVLDMISVADLGL